MTQSNAADKVWDFDAEPTDLTVTSTDVDWWWPIEGNPETGGFLAITKSVNSQNTVVVFPDIDDGGIVNEFKFQCDLRIGNAVGNDGRPADGFSICYARAGDAVLENAGTSDNLQQFMAVPGANEIGT